MRMGESLLWRHRMGTKGKRSAQGSECGRSKVLREEDEGFE